MFVSIVSRIAPVARSVLVNGSKQYLRPLRSAVISQSQTLAAQNTTPVVLLSQIRSFQVSSVTRDIDSAAKLIGAGAAIVGVAGSSGGVGILGFTLSEAMGLFCLMMAFLLLFAF